MGHDAVSTSHECWPLRCAAFVCSLGAKKWTGLVHLRPAGCRLGGGFGELVGVALTTSGTTALVGAPARVLR
jgi:hypothetical protein